MATVTKTKTFYANAYTMYYGQGGSVIYNKFNSVSNPSNAYTPVSDNNVAVFSVTTTGTKYYNAQLYNTNYSDIPSNATIISFTGKIRLASSGTWQYSDIGLYDIDDATSYVKEIEAYDNTVINGTKTITATIIPARNKLETLCLWFGGTTNKSTGSISVYGVEFEVTWTETVTDAPSKKLWLKDGSTWREVNNPVIWKKQGGIWIQKSEDDWDSIFDTNANYVKG